MAICFRIRFDFSERSRIKSDEPELSISDPVEGKTVRLKAGQGALALSEAREILLLGEPSVDEAQAKAAAERWVGILQRGLARVNVGADFGPEVPRSTFTEAGLQMLEGQSGVRTLNDVHGISVFDNEPKPRFVRQHFELQIGVEPERLASAIEETVAEGSVMSQTERLAYELYAASFFERWPEARFMMLMMAVETLIEPAPRSTKVREHVAELIAQTRVSNLPRAEIDSIVGSLGWLEGESIGQAGRRLAGCLGDRSYLDEQDSESAEQFFTRSYALRSALVHGHDPRPTSEEIGYRAAHLEHFVTDLVALGPSVQA